MRGLIRRQEPQGGPRVLVFDSEAGVPEDPWLSKCEVSGLLEEDILEVGCGGP